jgi:hypothetical protein
MKILICKKLNISHSLTCASLTRDDRVNDPEHSISLSYGSFTHYDTFQFHSWQDYHVITWSVDIRTRGTPTALQCRHTTQHNEVTILTGLYTIVWNSSPPWMASSSFSRPPGYLWIIIVCVNNPHVCLGSTCVTQTPRPVPCSPGLHKFRDTSSPYI